MRQFIQQRFTYGGRRGDDFGLYICEVENNSSRMFGVNKTIKEEKTNNFIPTFKGVEYETPTFQVTLVKLDEQGNIQPFDEDQNFEIIQWLFQSEEYLPFVSHDNKDVIYYAQFTKGQDFRKNLKYGYLTLEMRLNCGCAFSNIMHNNYSVSGSKQFNIFCKQNVEKYAHPDVEFKLTSGNSFSITNNTLGETMSFTGLPSGSHIYCYNEGLKQIVVVDNPSANVRQYFNKKWLRLVQGNNVLTVSGNCEVDVIFQAKVAIQ